MSQAELEAIRTPLVGSSPAVKTANPLKELSAVTETAHGTSPSSAPASAKDKVNKATKPSSSALVLRLNKSDRSILDRLSRDYAESMVTVLGKSLRLYRAIVEAGEHGGKLIMLTGGKHLARAAALTTDGAAKDIKLESQPVAASSDQAYETAVAVRYPFPDEGKSPIQLNPLCIKPSKGVKTERIGLRVNAAFIQNLASLEDKTGLSKSAVLRDSVHLYNFVKRESEKLDASFYIGDVLLVGI